MADTVRSGTNEKRTDPYRTIRPVRVHTSLLEGAFELEFVELESPQVGESGEQLWELFSTSFGPTKTLADTLPPERRESAPRGSAPAKLLVLLGVTTEFERVPVLALRPSAARS